MSLFDSILNRAGDAARAAADQLELAQRRRPLESEIAAHEEAIATSMRRLGRLALDHAVPLPQAVAHLAPSIRTREAELDTLRKQLVEAQRDEAQRDAGHEHAPRPTAR